MVPSGILVKSIKRKSHLKFRLDMSRSGATTLTITIQWAYLRHSPLQFNGLICGATLTIVALNTVLLRVANKHIRMSGVMLNVVPPWIFIFYFGLVRVKSFF
jgi:hypothetical protein